ncbi:MAG TPA: chromate transporter, partial [Candidatus Binataceae bacterium]|nr:chromate transporter [Candidatus Binataceae bacterium]
MNEPIAEQAAEASSVEARRPSLSKIFGVFLITGAISFGGGIVAYLHEYLVRRERWLDEEQFLDALEVGETLPGLNSVNMAVIVGDRMRGAIGAAAA